MADRIQHGRGGGERTILLFGEVYCCYVSFMVISQFSQCYFMLHPNAALIFFPFLLLYLKKVKVKQTLLKA